MSRLDWFLCILDHNLSIPTKHGYACRYWKDFGSYPKEEKNYCRTPSGDNDNDGGPWCYIYGRIRWERCNIPVCPGE